MNIIDLIDSALLHVAAPQTPTSTLQEWVDPIRKSCAKFGIDTVRELACFLSQSSHESSGYLHLEESLNYKPIRLMQVWPKRFPTLAIANQYAGNATKLANKVYGGRMGNGDEASGDGYIFRGRGLFQLTGRDNYTRFGKSVGMTAEQASVYINSKEGAAMSAAWFFDDRGIDRLAATPGVADETRAINGGIIGLPERKAHFDAVVNELIRRGA